MLSWHGALLITFSMCNLSLGFMLFIFLVEDISLRKFILQIEFMISGFIACKKLNYKRSWGLRFHLTAIQRLCYINLS